MSSVPVFLVLSVVSCSSYIGGGADRADDTENSGGSVGSGGTNSGGTSSGGTGSGGTASGGGGTGGGGSGGSSGSSGGAPGAGGLIDGSGGDSSGTGGDDGTGGLDSGTGGEPNSGDDSVPSEGCGTANPQTGTSSNPLNHGKPYYVKLPDNYDENTPYRLLFVFNPTGNPITWGENSAGYEDNGAAETAIRVYPHENPGNLSTSPGGWSGDDVASFPALYDAVLSNFCVDETRVFAVGESSGGDFASILGCEHGDKLRAIGPCATKPVNGYPLNAGQRNCTGDVTAIIMHGLNDSVVGSANGPATRDFYVDVNECSSTSEPVTGYTDTLSNCVMYTGCKEGFPVYWCQHQDPNYSGTQHGWPAFAADMTWEIFESY